MSFNNKTFISHLFVQPEKWGKDRTQYHRLKSAVDWGMVEALCGRTWNSILCGSQGFSQRVNVPKKDRCRKCESLVEEESK